MPAVSLEASAFREFGTRFADKAMDSAMAVINWCCDGSDLACFSKFAVTIFGSTAILTGVIFAPLGIHSINQTENRLAELRSSMNYQPKLVTFQSPSSPSAITSAPAANALNR
jgi:hypothetical protein